MSGQLVGVRGAHPDLGALDAALLADELVGEFGSLFDRGALARVQDALAAGDVSGADRVAAVLGLALDHDQAALAARLAAELAGELGPDARQVVQAAADGPAVLVEVEHGDGWDTYRLPPDVVRLLVDRYGLVPAPEADGLPRWARPGGEEE